ncbi:MAG: hypothetical protein R3C19_18645 [Planctomycetaceae bacterium]
MSSRKIRVIFVLFGAAAGTVAGCIVGLLGALGSGRDFSFLAETAPLPYHVPQYSGGVSLRLAMVHDVIHERFPKHGSAHYEERNRATREKLTGLSADDPQRFALIDDLAVGLDRLRRSEEGIPILRDKLAAQQASGQSGRDLYTTYANLGTLLIHASFATAIAGDDKAKADFREGVGFIRSSVEVKPEAHFGRERWQAAIAEFLLAAMEDPRLLSTFDCLGNRLDLDITHALDREIAAWDTGYSRTTDVTFGRGDAEYGVPEFFKQDVDPSDPMMWETLKPIREHITRVGAEREWDSVDVPSHRKPVPFDEPVLGIIGMWRQGGGANPHFALALGETMLRVGQRYIAWTAFARASSMADRFWPDPEVQEFLRQHCRQRQQMIAASIAATDDDGRSVDDVASRESPQGQAVMLSLLEKFEAELAYGQQYQQDYQQFEASQIAAGAELDAVGFFDGFNEARAPIASPVGSEEVFLYAPGRKRSQFRGAYIKSSTVLGAGLGATLFLMVSLCIPGKPGRQAGSEKPRKTDDETVAWKSERYDARAE